MPPEPLDHRARLRHALVGSGAGLAAAAAAALLLVALRPEAGLVTSSTGAWITAYVHDTLETGSFAAVANLCRVPNTRLNLVYPLLVTAGSWLSGASPILVGRLIAAAALGLAALLLGRLGGVGRDPWLGVLAAGALLWPPSVATAGLVRPESLAMAAVLGCALLAVSLAQGRGLLAWLGAGLLLGLTHQTREYLLAPAASALAVAWLMDLLRRAPGARAGAAAIRAGALVGGALITAALPLAMGFWPWNGLATLWGYGVGEAPQRHGLAELLYLPALLPAWGLGAAGLAVGAWRGPGPARDAALVLLGALLPFGIFFTSRQQSPQYYVLAEVLLLAGIAGWLSLIPWRWPRRGLALLLLAGACAWSMPRSRELLRGGQPTLAPRFHSEAWPARGAEVAAAVDWAMTWTATQPLLVVSQHIENLGALFVVRHGRPVISLYRDGWGAEIPDLRRFHQGQDLHVLTLAGPHHPAPAPPGCAPLDQLDTGGLLASLYRCPGDAVPAEASDRDYPCIDWLGACQQQDWLQGGRALLRERAWHPGPEFAGGTAPGILPFSEP